MKQTLSICIHIFPEGDVRQSDPPGHFIGIRHRGGDIVTGCYDPEAKSWQTITPFPPGIEVIPNPLDDFKEIYILYPGILPPQTYIALSQELNEKSVAITPLVCPEEADLEAFRTQFFRQ